ncbi:MAG TPA: hypothetical protein VL860_11485 [Planctomycetota bacterium]|nr:hypothetical protein [Planctomycetota bacterium]
MPLLRHSYRYQLGFLAFFLVAALTLSAVARAEDSGATKDKVDPDQTITDGCDKVLDIHGAIVRIRFVRHKIFIAVKSGSVDFKIPSGQKIFTIPAGTVVMVGPVPGTPTIGGITSPFNTLTQFFSYGPLIDTSNRNFTANGLNLAEFIVGFVNLGTLDHFNLGNLIRNNAFSSTFGNVFRVGPYLTAS